MSRLHIPRWLQIVIPRGVKYKWRGTAHVRMLLSSDKLQIGASMQHGIAVPKVCRTLIPHLIANEVC